MFERGASKNHEHSIRKIQERCFKTILPVVSAGGSASSASFCSHL